MAAQGHLWLPDHQLGVAATLSHAEELISQVADLLFSYQTQPDGIFELEEQFALPNTRTVVKSVRSMPKKIPLLVADALVALRAALEHSLFAEIEFRDGQLEEKAARTVEIPASRTVEDFEKWATDRKRSRPASLQPDSELIERIRSLQPFNQTDASNHPLARLVLHTNHAKHRTPSVTAVRIAAMYQDDQRPESIGDIEPRPEVPLRVGDVIVETPYGRRVPVTLFPTIGINRPGTGAWPILMTELDEISSWVRTQAVPLLITGNEPPEQILPTHYDISIGHNDERSAITAGSMITAIQRHQQRLSAVSAREDLVDMIAQLDHTLDPKKIEAWLAQLTDELVLERISRLTATDTDDVDIMIRNFGALTGMRDEVLAFSQDIED